MSKKEKRWYVQVVETLASGREKIDREIGPYENERLADKAQAGIDRNMNHERFFSRQVTR